MARGSRAGASQRLETCEFRRNLIAGSQHFRPHMPDSHKVYYGKFIAGQIGHAPLPQRRSYWSATSRSSSRMPKPDPQLRLISLSTDDMAVPAMSRCAQGVPSLMKRCRNCAAEIEPPHLPPVFFMSATFESIILSYFGPSGRRHNFSPVALPAAISRVASSSLLLKSPACSLPSATITAPVSVARLITAFG